MCWGYLSEQNRHVKARINEVFFERAMFKLRSESSKLRDHCKQEQTVCVNQALRLERI